jgi:hypothetical protein
MCDKDEVARCVAIIDSLGWTHARTEVEFAPDSASNGYVLVFCTQIDKPRLEFGHPTVLDALKWRYDRIYRTSQFAAQQLRSVHNRSNHVQSVRRLYVDVSAAR